MSKVAIYRRSIESLLSEIGNPELQRKIDSLLAYTEQLEKAASSPTGPKPNPRPIILPSRGENASASTYLREVVDQLQEEPFAAGAQDDIQKILDILSQ